MCMAKKAIGSVPNLAQNFPFRVQIALTYPPSPCGPLSGPTDLAWAHEITLKPLQSGQGKSGGDCNTPPGCAGGRSACCELGTKPEATRYLAV